jgi:cystathionine beta-synthase
VGRFLKERNPAVRVVAPDPVGSIYAEYARSHVKGEGFPYKVEGIGGDKIPTSLHFEIIDEFLPVSDADAFRMARRLTREEGLFVGGSAGLNVHGALEVARRLDAPEALVVTVLCDTGERYLSKVFDDAWMRENQMLEAVRVTAQDLLDERRGALPPLVSVPPSARVRQALNLMSTYAISEIPVIDGTDCVGALSEGPLMARVLDDASLMEAAVTETMGAPFPVVDAGMPLEQLTTMLSRDTPAVLVRRQGALAGIVTRYDVLRHVAGVR